MAPLANFSPAKSRRPESVATSAHADVEYSPWSTLAPKTWIPSVLFPCVLNGVQFGAWIPGFDISQRHHYDIYGGYDSRGLPFGLVSMAIDSADCIALPQASITRPNVPPAQKVFSKVWGGELGFEASIPGLRIEREVGPVFKRVESSQIRGLPINLSEWKPRFNIARY